ncbi:MAG: IclR family transcriptional regulator [Acetobacteraceae bacterium]|jgi:Transcriptional regulator|nr:IclR family transcriptional regulator [Acetobacteraceae bacterium]
MKNAEGNTGSALAARAQRVESRALAKGLALLEILATGEPRALRHLAAAIKLGKPSTLRLLRTLEATGFVVRNAEGNYLISRPWAQPESKDRIRRLMAAATPEMTSLNADLAETVSLAALMDDHIRVVDTLESPKQIRMSNYRNRILPPYASSLGKAIAAFQSPEQLQVLLHVYGIYATTEKTITDPVAIREELERVRQRGWASEYEESVQGGCCFGVPIRCDGEPVGAAISVSLPISRLTPALEQRIPAMLLEAACRIASRVQAAE